MRECREWSKNKDKRRYVSLVADLQKVLMQCSNRAAGSLLAGLRQRKTVDVQAEIRRISEGKFYCYVHTVRFIV
jgi:hypothetical protein